MSIIKSEYLGSKIPTGCPPEHIIPLEGDDNSSGKLLDVHKLADSDPEWDAINNSNLEVLGKRLLTLERKTGELGYNPNASGVNYVAKDANNPNYADQGGPSSIGVGKGGSLQSYPIGETIKWLVNGVTHKDSLINHDKVLNELHARVGVPFANPSNPSDGRNNFVDTYRFGVTSNFITVPDFTFTFPKGPVTVPTITTTVTTKTFPAYYISSDALSEAIAKLDYSIYNEISALRSELNTLKHYVGAAFEDINRIKSVLINDSVLIIDPEWDVDDNGLTISSGGTAYVSSVVYTIIIKQGTTAGTSFTISSATASTITGATVMSSNPYSLILRVSTIPSPYNPGSPTSIEVTVVATDAAGNNTTSNKIIPV